MNFFRTVNPDCKCSRVAFESLCLNAACPKCGVPGYRVDNLNRPAFNAGL